MSQVNKVLISSDGINHIVSMNNKIFKKGIFFGLNSGDKIPINSKSLKYIIENKLKNITVKELLEHIDIIKPYSLLYHERKCYLKLFKLELYPGKKYYLTLKLEPTYTLLKVEPTYTLLNMFEMFNCFRLKDWYKLPSDLRIKFLNYLKEYGTEKKVRKVSELIEFDNKCSKSGFLNMSFNNLHKGVNNFFHNKYLLEHFIRLSYHFPYVLREIISDFPQLLKDKMIAKQICLRDGKCILHIDPILKNNRSLVKLACQQNGKALEFAPEKFRDDKKIVIIACHNHYSALKFASKRLKDDDDVYKSALNSIKIEIYTPPLYFVFNYKLRKYVPSLHTNTYEIIIPKHIGSMNCYFDGSCFGGVCDNLVPYSYKHINKLKILDLVSERIRNDKNLVKLAIEKNPLEIFHASKKISYDMELVMLAYKINPDIIQLFPTKIIMKIEREKVSKTDKYKNIKLDRINYRKINQKKSIPQNLSRVRKYRV